MVNTYIEYNFTRAEDGRSWLSTSTHLFVNGKLVHAAYTETEDEEATAKLEAFASCELVKKNPAHGAPVEWDVGTTHFTMDTYRLELEG